MASRVVPTFLNPDISHATQDRPLAEVEFSETWAYFQPAVVVAARRSGATGAEADDIAQEVAIIFLRKVRNGDVRAAVPAIHRFLYVLVRRTLAASRRKRSPASVESERLSNLEADTPDPELVVAHRQDVSTLDRVARTKLSPREWGVILGGAEGVASSDLANQLGTTPGNIRVIRFRAISILRRELEHSLNREKAA